MAGGRDGWSSSVNKSRTATLIESTLSSGDKKTDVREGTSGAKVHFTSEDCLFYFYFCQCHLPWGTSYPAPREGGVIVTHTHTHTRLHNYIYTRTYTQTHEYSTRTQSDVVHPAFLPVFLQTRDPVSRPPLVTGPPEDKTYPDLAAECHPLSGTYGRHHSAVCLYTKECLSVNNKHPALSPAGGNSGIRGGCCP